MNKVKVTADAVLSIILGIFSDEDINTVITDPTAPEEWQNKTLLDALNVEYFTFKHRPVSTEDIIAEKIREGKDSNSLIGLDRAFCAVSLGGVERLFSKDADTAVITANMEYWLQTDKIKLLEFLIEDCNIATSGKRTDVTFGAEECAEECKEHRRAIVIFSPVNVVDVQTDTICGELAVCDITVNILLYPDIVNYSDYEVMFEWTSETGEVVATKEAMPLTSLSYVNTMTQRPVPYIANKSKVGSINLSCANSFVLVFDGYSENDFINYITDKALSLTQNDNNDEIKMILTRKEKSYIHNVVIKDHQVTVNADTGNETHTLSLVTRGIK